MNTDATQIGLSMEHLPPNIPYFDVTEAIIGAAFEVHNQLGYGFLERVYQRALQVELLQRGLKVTLEHSIAVHYKGALIF